MGPRNIILTVTLAVILIGGLVLWLEVRNRQLTDQQRGRQTVSKENRTIQITKNQKHSIPLNEIVSGGPPKDGIPSIDKPRFVSVNETNKYLKDDEPGLALTLNSINRFYPFQILVWHEIVNDTINGQRVLITYCPLCFTGIVFDSTVGGEQVEFGVSGKLWNSNLLMYDRKTDSLWSQVLGEAVVGEMTGTKLAVLPSDIVKYGEWKKLHPNGQVLSRDTGLTRSYGNDPYGDYYTTPGTYFPLRHKDDRLPEKAFVLGLVIDDKAKAYSAEVVKQVKEVRDSFQERTIIARYEEDIDAVRLYEEKSDGILERLAPVGAFWFSWAAAHPGTEVYK